MLGTARARRPLLATLAALLFVGLGLNLVVTSLVDLVGVGAAALVGGPDPMSWAVGLVLAGIAALFVLAGIAIGALEILVGLRIWLRRDRFP